MGESVKGNGTYIAKNNSTGEETIITMTLSRLNKTTLNHPTMTELQTLLTDFATDAAAINLKVTVNYTNA